MNNSIYSLNNQRIFITGAAGFIGSALANHLSINNAVSGLDNLSTGDWGRCNSRILRMETDLATASERDLVDMLQGQDILFHLAAVKLHNVENSDSRIIQSNISASNKLFTAAGLAGIKRVIFTSSLYANGSLGPSIMQESDRENPATLYGASKLFSERDLAIASFKFGFSYAIPRLFFIYGPKQFSTGGYKSVIVSNFQRGAEGLPMQITGSGNQVLDYVYIDDCIESLVSIAQSSFQGVIHVSSGTGVSIEELVKAMNEISNNPGVINTPPDWTAGTRRVGSNELLLKVTSRTPKTSLTHGLKLTWESISNE